MSTTWGHVRRGSKSDRAIDRFTAGIYAAINRATGGER